MHLKSYFLLFAALSYSAMAATFKEDVDFLHNHTEISVLSDDTGASQVAVAPAWQGRVMTSTAAGDTGSSFGWVNRELIASGKLQPHINVFGGEDRLWLGPEGSQYSIYFAPGAKFDSENWYVPAPFDTLPFRTMSQSKGRALFRAELALTNYSGTRFRVAIEREIRVLEQRAAWERLGLTPAKHLSLVAYESNNTLINTGAEPWKGNTGMLSIWILGMLNASPSTTIVVPIKSGQESELGPKVTPYKAYGAQPPERLQATDSAVFFRGDAQFRGKIGIGPKRSLGRIGSYDAAKHVLTLVQFNQPQGVDGYVNSSWGPQDHPYDGDAINSYNDGAPSPGAKPFGPFYELESSSPAAALAPGGRLEHTHRTFHLTGPEDELDAVARAVLGVSLAQIEAALPSDGQPTVVPTQRSNALAKAVLVTGAGTGIGRKITERLAGDGYFVYAGVRKEAELQALSTLHNVKALHLDVTDEHDIATAVDTVAKDGRGLYALINNAGVFTVGSVLDTSQKEFDLVMDVNVRGPYRLTKAFAPQIIAQKGRIVTIGSTSGIAAWANGSAYSMSKHAMEAFTDSLAGEMEPLGVSIIDPGNYNSQIARAAVERAGLDSRLADRSQFKEPDEVAAAAALALSEPKPKRRYLVTPDETEAQWAINSQIERLIQLNEGQPYTFDRKTLTEMLDAALAHARPRTQ